MRVSSELLLGSSDAAVLLQVAQQALRLFLSKRNRCKSTSLRCALPSDLVQRSPFLHMRAFRLRGRDV